MKIERQIVDKLGLKLYDKIPAVVAEVVANAYDADAELVKVRLPLGKALAVRRGKKVDEKGYVVEIIDNGHGMTPDEANAFFLRVGKDRRLDPRQGNRSRNKKRPVMGRKGIGKLAPFGVCRRIEVRSAGGDRTSRGYKVTHFELSYDKIVGQAEGDDVYHPRPLADDGKYDAKSGTLIRMTEFHPRVVPDKDTFGRQLSYRFLPLPDFRVRIEDTKKSAEKPFFVAQENLALAPNTKIVVNKRPVITEGGERLKVRGWVAMAKQPYKNVEFAGIRVYARGKIAAVTRDFGSPAGFTGEFVARSYLVGELHADWLDEEEDLIQTHRQDILWSTELGQAFSAWGQTILREVARKGREPRRQTVRETFLRVSRLRETAEQRFQDPALRDAALELGQQIGGFASEDELEDNDYVEGLREIILTVAPHKLLMDTFRRIEQLAVDGKIDMRELVRLFSTSRIAQLASYGQIADEKVKAIDLLEKLVRMDGAPERDFQSILENAPWLIHAEWVPMTANQKLETFRSAFEAWHKKATGEEIVTSTIASPNKRPDFVLLDLESRLVIVEIKPPRHTFADDDYDRLERYFDSLVAFLQAHPKLAAFFPGGLRIILVRDSERVSSKTTKALNHLVREGNLERLRWEELLANTKQANQDFLQARSAMLRAPTSQS